MKKLVVLITLAATAYGYSQSTLGSVSFVTRVGTTVNALITYKDGPVNGVKPSYAAAPAGTYVVDGTYTWGGPNARAMLYAKAGSDLQATLAPITPNVPFKPWSGTTGGYAGYVDATWNGTSGYSTDRAVPGTEPAGTNPSEGFPQQAVFQIKAWDTGTSVADSMTYEQAKAVIDAAGKGYYGVGNIFLNPVGGGSAASAFLTGATGFQITWVPEPSIIGLGILGAVAGMVVFRRRQ